MQFARILIDSPVLEIFVVVFVVILCCATDHIIHFSGF